MMNANVSAIRTLYEVKDGGLCPCRNISKLKTLRHKLSIQDFQSGFNYN